MMAIVYIVAGILIIILFFKIAGKSLEDKEVSNYGGLEVMYSEYFKYLEETFPSLIIDKSIGSSITYRFLISETGIQFEFKTQYNMGILFTNYKVYISKHGKLQLLHTSQKYRFENALIHQSEMFESIATRVIRDHVRLTAVANRDYPNRDLKEDQNTIRASENISRKNEYYETYMEEEPEETRKSHTEKKEKVTPNKQNNYDDLVDYDDDDDLPF